MHEELLFFMVGTYLVRWKSMCLALVSHKTKQFVLEASHIPTWHLLLLPSYFISNKCFLSYLVYIFLHCASNPLACKLARIQFSFLFYSHVNKKNFNTYIQIGASGTHASIFFISYFISNIFFLSDLCQILCRMKNGLNCIIHTQECHMHSVPNYMPFNFFYIKFDHSSY